MTNEPQWDASGLKIGGRPKGIHIVRAPDGELVAIPKGIRADELFDEEERQDDSMRAFATACLKMADIAVVGINKESEVVGTVFLKGKIITGATMRRAARAAVKAGYREAVVVVNQGLDTKSREAAMKMFDMCLVKLKLLVVETS